VITSNFPERIDKALIRPGRIDVKVEFRRADRQFILDMLNHFYECQKSLGDIPSSVADKFTPAEVMETMCMHFKDPDGALTALIQRASSLASGTSLDELMDLSDSDSASTISQRVRVAPEPTPKPTVTVEEIDLTGSKSCPWAAQRLYKSVPAESLYEQLGVLIPENKSVNTFGPIDCMRVVSNIELRGIAYTREQLVDQYGEANVVLLEKHREESSKCMQVMTNEIISDPEAWNAADDEELLVSCDKPFPTMEHPPEIAAHFNELFASLASDPETAGKINGTIPVNNRYCMSTSMQ
jgi:hypothetical protein